MVALVMACSVVPALGQEGQSGGEGRLQERLQERWKFIQQRIELIITRFNNNQQRHREVYERVKSTVGEFLEKMKTKGSDVSKLEQDLATWKGMFEEFAQDYQAFIQKLEEIAALSPEQAQGNFYSLLHEARQLLRVVRQDAMDIRLFYQQTIRADIQELRGQLPESA
jgi:predicted nuclease with TOPRIM domain